MVRQDCVLGGRACQLWADEAVLAGRARAQCLLVQTMGRHERPSIGQEVSLIAGGAGPWVMAFFEVYDWATDLTPWPDPKIDRNPEVGRHAEGTLDFVTNILAPALTQRFGPLPVILGGYSLGGLFALWASMHTDRFAAVAAASPSLWIRDWLPYAQVHPVLASAVYLSLGDREEHVRNAAIARVGDCVRRQYALLQSQLGESACTLRWESGGHFSDNDARLARAFSWCIENVRK